jgi:hypothetical protein
VDIDSVGALTLDSGAAINLEPAAGSVILLDGTISVDAGVVTGATSITSTAFVGTIDGVLGGNTPAAATITTLGIDDSAAATPASKTLYEDSIVKRWCNHTHATTINDDVGISSITNGSTGQYTFTFATAMGNISYSCTPAVRGTQTSVVATIATTSQLLFLRDSSFVLADGSLNMQIVGSD